MVSDDRGLRLASWLEKAKAIGQLIEVEGADLKFKLGCITDLNAKRSVPTRSYRALVVGRGRCPTSSARWPGGKGEGTSVVVTGSAQMGRPRRWIAVPGTILGFGLGGFVDGILLHQILQWHHMLSSTNSDNIGVKYYPVNTIPGLQMNTMWDGFFHAVTWLSVLIGLGLLYSRVTTSRGKMWRSRALWGWILLGWGVFNLVEGIIDHHILAIHHVRTGPNRLWWDLGFLALGAVLLAGGWLIQRGAPTIDLCREHPSTPQARRDP